MLEKVDKENKSLFMTFASKLLMSISKLSLLSAISERRK